MIRTIQLNLVSNLTVVRKNQLHETWQYSNMFHGTGIQYESCGYREGSEASRGAAGGRVEAGADLGSRHAVGELSQEMRAGVPVAGW
jgi:hypothetical protein